MPDALYVVHPDIRMDEYTGQIGRQKPSMLHYHNSHELVFVETGSSTILTENGIYKVSGSYVIFYPAGVPHRQINDPEQLYHRYLCSIPPTILNDILPQGMLPERFFVLPLHEDELARIKKYLELIRQELPQENCQLRRMYLVAGILCELSPIISRELSNVPHRSTAAEQLVHTICIYLDNHSSETLRLDEIAKQFFISRAKLSRSFRTVLNLSVCEYICSVRVEKSKQYLEKGVSVQEAAALSGFANVGHYIRTFRRLVGMTPAKYRAGLQESVNNI